jgi:hypothetical protein
MGINMLNKSHMSFILITKNQSTKNLKNNQTCIAPLLHEEERNPLTSPKTGDLWKKKDHLLSVGAISTESVFISAPFRGGDRYVNKSNFIAIITANQFEYKGNVLD